MSTGETNSDEASHTDPNYLSQPDHALYGAAEPKENLDSYIGDQQVDNELSEIEQAHIDISNLIDQLKLGKDTPASIKQLYKSMQCVNKVFSSSSFEPGELAQLLIARLIFINNPTNENTDYDDTKLQQQQLKNLFDLCVIKASNADMMEQTLILFTKMQQVYYHDNTITEFYNEYLENLMRDLSKNESNYSIVCKIYEFWSMLYYKMRSIDICKLQYKRATFLEFDANKMMLTIFDELEQVLSLKNEKYERILCIRLLSMLLDIIIASEQNNRVLLTKELSDTIFVLSDEMKSALKYIFDIFATNDDGTMCGNDMRRYIVACGADQESRSDRRIQMVFTSFSEFEDKTKLGINGFYEFYVEASDSRPEYVWDDIIVYNFDTSLKLFSNEYESKDDEINITKKENKDSLTLRDNMIYDEMYYKLLTDLMNRMSEDYDQETRERISKILFKLPKSYIMQKQMYDMKESFDTLLGTDTVQCMLYRLLILDSICSDITVDNEWKQRFLDQKGFDYLIKIMLKLYYTAHDNVDYSNMDIAESQTYQLGLEMVIKIMFNLSNVGVSMAISNSQFRRKVLGTYEYLGKYMIFIKIMQDIDKNDLVQLICLVRTIDDEEGIGLFQVISPNIARIYIEPLIFGYVRECDSADDVPDDIIKLCRCFFC